jgi:hypothetical protein
MRLHAAVRVCLSIALLGVRRASQGDGRLNWRLAQPLVLFVPAHKHTMLKHPLIAMSSRSRRVSRAIACQTGWVD